MIHDVVKATSAFFFSLLPSSFIQNVALDFEEGPPVNAAWRVLRP